VFTLEGVLVGSAAVHAATWRQTFDEFLAGRGERTHGRFDPDTGRLEPFDPQREYLEHLHGKPRLEGVRAFLASRGIRLPEGEPADQSGEETVHGLANRKTELFERLLDQRRLDSYAGARRYLELVRDAGIRCAIVSASAHTDAILERAGLAALVDARVDAGVIADEGLAARVAPDRLLAACRHLGLTPGQAALFETTTTGIAAGRAVGFHLIIAVDRSEQRSHADALHSEGADRIVSDLAQLLETKPQLWR
jgi:beta-phosphoglucomutase-like phosphatase (HAD superfamily)